MLREDKTLVCNGCGAILSDGSTWAGKDYLAVEKEWGYFSKKDGEIHSFALCEECYDRLVAGFRHPAAVREKTELL